MTTVNFAKALQDAKSASFEALPIGSYEVEVESSTATRSSTDKPMLKVTMRVLDGPYARRPVINNFVMSLENPTALAIFFRHMKCFGLDENFFTQLGAVGSLEPVAQALVGRRAKLQLGHRQWQGETRNEVVGISPYTGAPRLQDPSGELGLSVFAPGTPGPTAPGAPTPAPSAPPAPPSTPTPTTAPVQHAPVPAPTPTPPPTTVTTSYQPTVITGPVAAVPTTEAPGTVASSPSSSPAPTTSEPVPQPPQSQHTPESSPQPTAAPAPPELPF